MHQRHLWCDVIALWKVHAQRPETKRREGTMGSPKLLQPQMWRQRCKEAGVNLLKG